MARFLMAFVLLNLFPALCQAQYFEGELFYNNYYLDKQTLKPLFEKIPEKVLIKANFQKIDVLGTGEGGGLDWQVLDFKNGWLYSKENRPDANIIKDKICVTAEKDTFQYEMLDTTFNVSGIISHVMIETRNGVKTAEYYYAKDIKLDPAHFNCTRSDKLNNFYKQTGGSLITQLVQFGKDYTFIYKLEDLKKRTVADTEFVLPANIPIIDR